MHPRDLSIKDFTYVLSEDRIAKYPLAERDSSKLLIYKEGKITEDLYRNIATHIPENSLLVFNDSKVVQARLIFQKPTGGTVEIFCLEPAEQYPDISSAMLQRGEVYWHCLVGGASKWKHGQVMEKKITTGNEPLTLFASYKEKKAGYFVIALSWTPVQLSFAEVLQQAGIVPLPPYLKRDPESLDTERYQTIFARFEGSVAAPTAGLHFTPLVFEKLSAKNIRTDFVTLHVGAGTFKPVKAETIAEHEMHTELFEVSRETIGNLLHFDDKIIAVGTTSLRTIESLYWLGVSLQSTVYSQPSAVNSTQSTVHSRQSAVNSSQSTVHSQQSAVSNSQSAGNIHAVGQWDPYECYETPVSPKEAMQSLLRWMDMNKTDRLLARTQIIIAPGYKFKMVKALITNFHQPQSTLLLLIAALTGEKWKEIYEFALQNDFRFLSYGDGCFLWISP